MEEETKETKKNKKSKTVPLWKNIVMIILIVLIVVLIIYFLITSRATSGGIYRYEGKIDEGGRAVFKKGSEPTLSITKQQAQEACLKIGARLISMEDWGRLANEVLKESTFVNGNNNFGRSKEEGSQVCEVVKKEGVPEGICLTGTGPSSWCYKGICDLNGNLAEWVDFPDVVDGIVKIQGKEYTLVSANYDMEKALGRDGVENLIPQQLDPSPDTSADSGASIMITKNSEDFDYPKTIPIKKDTILGDFDQFRNGDSTKYGDGKYYLWIPTYDKNNNKKEDGPTDIASEILVCDSFDGNAFTDCEHYRGCALNSNQIKDNQRISSTIPSMLRGVDCPETSPSSLVLTGYIQDMREGDLSSLALPSKISIVGNQTYNNDIFKIAPYGFKLAVRGGSWQEGEKSGIFSLDLSFAQDGKSWSVGFRCAK